MLGHCASRRVVGLSIDDCLTLLDNGMIDVPDDPALHSSCVGGGGEDGVYGYDDDAWDQVSRQRVGKARLRFVQCCTL